MSFLINPYRFVTAGIDPDVQDWIDRVVAAGSSVSSTHQTAVNTFVASLKSSGVWTDIQRLNVFAGANLTAALIPLKKGIGSTTETNTGFVSGDYSESSGLTGDGSSYIDTGVSITTDLTKSDFGMGVFVKTCNSIGVRTDIGSSYVATGDTNRFYLGAVANSFGGVIWGVGNLYGNPTVIGTSQSGKVVSLETTGTTNAVIYSAGSSVASSASWNNNGFQSGTVRVFSASGAYSVNTLSGYYIGNNLNQAALQTAFTTLKSDLGR